MRPSWRQIVKKLKVVSMGSDVQGVRLEGDRRNPEPIYFRVVLPFGDVDIVRTSDNDYWVHIRVNRPDAGMNVPGVTKHGRVLDACINAHDKSGGEIDASILDDDQLYHLAVKLGPDGDKA
jgi:hypothetical protein